MTVDTYDKRQIQTGLDQQTLHIGSTVFTQRCDVCCVLCVVCCMLCVVCCVLCVVSVCLRVCVLCVTCRVCVCFVCVMCIVRCALWDVFAIKRQKKGQNKIIYNTLKHDENSVDKYKKKAEETFGKLSKHGLRFDTKWSFKNKKTSENDHFSDGLLTNSVEIPIPNVQKDTFLS